MPFASGRNSASFNDPLSFVSSRRNSAIKSSFFLLYFCPPTLKPSAVVPGFLPRFGTIGALGVLPAVTPGVPLGVFPLGVLPGVLPGVPFGVGFALGLPNLLPRGSASRLWSRRWSGSGFGFRFGRWFGFGFGFGFGRWAGFGGSPSLWCPSFRLSFPGQPPPLCFLLTNYAHCLGSLEVVVIPGLNCA